MKRKPHRQFCSICHEVDRVPFHVPDEVWELATHINDRYSLICLRCFTRMADERGVEWDKEITFYPVSQITQDRIRETTAKREYHPDDFFRETAERADAAGHYSRLWTAHHEKRCDHECIYCRSEKDAEVERPPTAPPKPTKWTEVS